MKEITEKYERQLWEQLDSLLADVVADGARKEEVERAIMSAILAQDSEIRSLHRQIQNLARSQSGYLRERLKEDSPLTRARRRLYGKWA